MTLPAKHPAYQPAAPTVAPSPAPSAGRVLIADDEPAFARPLAELFRREGFDAVAVFDGATARAALDEADFDLLVADINMPGNPGLELVQALANDPRGVAIILLTGAPSVATAARAVQLGATAYLLKPIDFDELLPLAHSAITRRRTVLLARDQRRHLAAWLRDAEAIEAALRSPGAQGQIAPGDFIAGTANNLLLALLEFRRSAELLAATQPRVDSVWQANTLQVLQRSVDVLERTRRNFKSTELRDLRHELQSLVDSFAAASATPPRGVGDGIRQR